ncbi:MAG: hypothetical protein AAGA99_19985 [Actinomycetota bacterium]
MSADTITIESSEISLTLPQDLEAVPVEQLVELLNDAFDAELERRRAALEADAELVDPDSGLRAAKGLMIASAAGAAVWTGIIATIVVAA